MYALAGGVDVVYDLWIGVWVGDTFDYVGEFFVDLVYDCWVFGAAA
jgi:hypothetical protein